ncbi:DUF6516 family protein [Salipaludibacillus aurantiacus]|uniref:Uncharacterized protein n=1 Tax=Salipaludibacillus aurantiacus TaxID=1601833 RepID=A0A1H9X4Y5_9BACI|nr:DUF6516 family protein [Salipaludibacillus aurantiacus]SES41268.1 hypothetical protein SAMN05518684_12515 [Salipaludibacillus aurantiacus]
MSNLTSYQARRIEYITTLFETNPQLFEHEKNQSVLSIQRKGAKRIAATLPLRDHAHYGETVLVISEKLNNDGRIAEYHYGWELSQREHRMGKQPRHITAFGNEWKDPETPAWVDTNPYHHHHVPQEPSKRQSTGIEDLQSAITILTDFISGDLSYDKTYKFLDVFSGNDEEPFFSSKDRLASHRINQEQANTIVRKAGDGSKKSKMIKSNARRGKIIIRRNKKR